MTSSARVWVVATVTLLSTTAVTAAQATATAKPTPQSSKTFAGYEVTKPTTHVKKVTTTFVVPTITCKKSFSGVGPSVLVQTTPDKHNTITDDVAAVGVGCENKMPSYESIITVDGTTFNDFPFAARDVVSVSVTLTKSKTSVTVVDLTSKAKKTRTGAGRLGATAFIGDQGLVINTHKTGLDPFTKTSFTDSEVNGKSLTAEHAAPFDRKRGSTVQISVSKLSNGKNFTLNFEHS